ncbi:HAMP domain-containing sensor histidine kinase [uncultured Desulfobacter sp.]|uniref:sensor histidine kinase n=1 Tax=uncultured Desulfobacter sp. TaxID=240139 RepID=UPI0029F54C63|nr:HAMP domain-containing sensor histidine kinase [uncultured Desulfobacter sp.]
MKYRYSLRNRIVIAFGLFGLFLAMTFWFFIDSSMGLVEDAVFRNRLKNEISYYLEQAKADPKCPLPSSRYINAYLDFASMPKAYKNMATGLSEGFYETNGPGAVKGPGDLHLGIKKIPGKGALYLFYDVGTLKVEEKYESIVSLGLFGSSLLVAAIGAGLGAAVAGKIIEPVTKLTTIISQSDPDHLPVELGSAFARDEIGFLAKNLEQSMKRIRKFIEREKTFTRDASHELRNPLTVIKGAVELISQMPEYRDAALQRPLKRIEKSVAKMAVTIETFLMLAREDTALQPGQSCDVESLARTAFNEHRDQFENPLVETRYKADAHPRANAPAAVFRMVLDNLLRNAFYYTPEGRICLTVGQDYIRVSNSGAAGARPATPGEWEKHPKGHGFGLNIVKQLCERFGWHLEISSGPGQDTCVILAF